MNYGELKQNIISLGFAENSDYEEYEQLGYTCDAINRAIQTIEDYFPYKEKFDFSIDESDTGIMYVDMADREGFLSLTDTPVMYESNGEEVYRKFTEYEIEQDHIIVIKADDYDGSFRIYFNKRCTPVTPETDNKFIPELPLAAHHLIPLLASYYLWLDDDERKAVMYKNDYEEALTAALQRSKQPRATVVSTEWGDI